MSPQRFDELVSDALDLIPPELAAAIDNVVVLVEARNPDEPDLLGLYHGVALTERDSWYAGSLPDTITIYREALLEVCEDDDEVVDEVAITVIHEIAHHFGIDDERLHELGWGCAGCANTDRLDNGPEPGAATTLCPCPVLSRGHEQ